MGQRPPDQGGPLAAQTLIRITSPTDGQRLDVDSAIIEGVIEPGQQAPSRVFVKVGPNLELEATSDDGLRSWRVEAKLPSGSFAIVATMVDAAGVTLPSSDAVRVERADTPVDSAPPTVLISAPADGSQPGRSLVLLEGESSDDVGVVRMELYRGDERLDERAFETQDFYGRWARLVPLIPGQDNVLRVVAYDALGQEGSASLSLKGSSEQDTTPPELQITSHRDQEQLQSETLVLAGSASDLAGIREVKVRIGALLPDGQTLAFSEYQRAITSDGFNRWEATLPIGPGPLTVQVRAIDVHGLSTQRELTLTNTLLPQWGDERQVFLRLRPQDRPPRVSLELDRQGVDQIIAPMIQEDVLLLELDPGPLLNNALEQIKNACGLSWRQDNPDANHDCALTPLGQSFLGPDGTWRSSPEYALVRLLTMTPANVIVQGTSIEGLQRIADGAILGIRIGGGFNQILSDVLGISRTSEIVPTAQVAQALRLGWLAPHPNTTPEGKLPITLRDAMTELSGLGPRLGPMGAHPGVVDPSQPVSSRLLEPSFKMRIEATSNLRWLDGMDLSQGKEYMAVVVDQVGPSRDDVLEFDFNDPARFEVQGLVANPKVDLRVKLNEDDAFISSCNDDNACKANRPGAPSSPASIWSKPGWLIEAVVTYGAWLTYQARTFERCYIRTIGCQANVKVGKGSDPQGWSQFDIIFNIGNPPKDQYLWELILEVAQVALHRLSNTTVPEGDADVAFTLKDVSVGVSADDLREAMRPYLQDQRATLSARILGDYAKNNGALDLYYRRGDDDLPYLYFIDSQDPRPERATYAYSRPGFFLNEGLTEDSRASRKDIPGSGDTTHEKFALTPGTHTLYMRDDKDQLYRIELQVRAGSDEIFTRTWRKLR